MPLFFNMNTIKKYWYLFLPLSVVIIIMIIKKFRKQGQDATTNLLGLAQADQGASVLDFQDQTGSARNLTDQQLAVIADTIEAAIYGSSGWSPTEDDDLVFAQLQYIWTNADFVALVQIWGTRGGSWFTSAQTLPEAIASTLDEDLYTQLRQIYNARGIQI